ncbi:MAG TPA: tyrosine-type recombinase/integrase [Mycobacterium sp.]
MVRHRLRRENDHGRAQPRRVGRRPMHGGGERAENRGVAAHPAAGRGTARRAAPWLGCYAQEKLALGAAHADSGYVAVNEAGQPYTPGALTHMWRKLAKTAVVRPIRLHDARHSCGTALHLRGVPLAVIAKWLGHANPAITARIYAHSQDEALAAAASLGAVVTNEGVLRDLMLLFVLEVKRR